jgi:hypothetical protein
LVTPSPAPDAGPVISSLYRGHEARWRIHTTSGSAGGKRMRVSVRRVVGRPSVRWIADVKRICICCPVACTHCAAASSRVGASGASRRSGRQQAFANACGSVEASRVPISAKIHVVILVVEEGVCGSGAPDEDRRAYPICECVAPNIDRSKHLMRPCLRARHRVRQVWGLSREAREQISQ